MSKCLDTVSDIIAEKDELLSLFVKTTQFINSKISDNEISKLFNKALKNFEAESKINIDNLEKELENEDAKKYFFDSLVKHFQISLLNAKVMVEKNISDVVKNISDILRVC